MTGEGEDRDANFASLTGDHRTTYTWAAYRVNRRWVMGSSADRIRLLDSSVEHFKQSAEERVGW